MQRLVFCLTAWLAAALSMPVRALEAMNLAVIVNTSDPLSVQIGEYYAARRRISFQNMIKVAFRVDRTTLTREEFEMIKAEVDKKTLPVVQAYALTWASPYRVECMSITSAFAFGYDPAFCVPGCKPTRPSPYFNSRARRPYGQLRMRPSMALAATSFEQAKALIDRGVQSDATQPVGTGYLLSTSDATRNVRSAAYPLARRLMEARQVKAVTLRQNELSHVHDVFFYFTGMASVAGLETLSFLPGAVADHLTSSGGQLTNPGGQMSALRWLEAGATGSYGTVVEPCNLPQKFPNPAVLAAHYLLGDTLVEAYWKSVAMPGQGIFVGEPLASPFRTRSPVQ